MTGIFGPTGADGDPSMRMQGSGLAFGLAYTSYYDLLTSGFQYNGVSWVTVAIISETTWYDANGNAVAQEAYEGPGYSGYNRITVKRTGTAFGDAYVGVEYGFTTAGSLVWIEWLDASAKVVDSESFGPDGSYSITANFTGVAYGYAYSQYERDYDAQGALKKTIWFDADRGTVASKSFRSDGSYDIMVYAAGTAYGQNYATYDNFYVAGTLDHTIWQWYGGQTEAVKTYHSGGGYDVWIGQGGFALDTSFAAFDYDFTASGALDRETLYASDGSVAAVKTIQDDGSYDIHRYFAGAPGGTASTDMFYSAAGDLTKTLVYDSSGGFTIVLPHAS